MIDSTVYPQRGLGLGRQIAELNSSLYGADWDEDQNICLF